MPSWEFLNKDKVKLKKKWNADDMHIFADRMWPKEDKKEKKRIEKQFKRTRLEPIRRMAKRGDHKIYFRYLEVREKETLRYLGYTIEKEEFGGYTVRW